MGNNGVHAWDCIGLAIIVASCVALLYLNAKWRDWINRKR